MGTSNSRQPITGKYLKCIIDYEVTKREKKRFNKKIIFMGNSIFI
jgi:hypothetical protein